jgi:hypothetical protein
MNKAQRVVLIAAAICILHSSMVPPVAQAGETVCRYHEFTVRHLPFTRGYEIAGGDPVALIAEYGMIVSVAAVAFLALGWRGRG